MRAAGWPRMRQVSSAFAGGKLAERRARWRVRCAQGFTRLPTSAIHPALPLSHARVASPKLVMEEAPESYKDVSAVVDTCHAAGISKKAVKLRPIGVVKG